MCRFKEIGGKKTFSSTNYFFLPRLLFFFFSLATPFSNFISLFIHTQFFSPSATFSKPALYYQSANFYCILQWTAAGWPFKKEYSMVVLFLQPSWSLFSFPLDCHCVFPDYQQAVFEYYLPIGFAPQGGGLKWKGAKKDITLSVYNPLLSKLWKCISVPQNLSYELLIFRRERHGSVGVPFHWLKIIRIFVSWKQVTF